MKHRPLDTNWFHEILSSSSSSWLASFFRFWGALNKMTMSLGQTIRCLPILKSPTKIADEFFYINDQPSIFRSIPGVSSMDFWPSENMDPAWQRHCHRSLDLQRSLWWISDVLGICWMVISWSISLYLRELYMIFHQPQNRLYSKAKLLGKSCDMSIIHQYQVVVVVVEDDLFINSFPKSFRTPNHFGRIDFL